MKIKLTCVLLVIFLILSGCGKNHTLNNVWSSKGNSTIYLKKQTKIKLTKSNGKKEAQFYTKNFGNQSCVDKVENRSANLKFFCSSEFIDTQTNSRILYKLSLYKPVNQNNECDENAYKQCKGNKNCFCVLLSIDTGSGGGPGNEVGTGGNIN